MRRVDWLHKQPEITPRAELSEAATGDRFLILVEGSETERRYLEDLCGKLNFSAYNVFIESPDTDPLNLIERAIELRAKEAALAEENLTVAYNQVWVVCDRESKFHERRDRLEKACGLAEKNNILIALSIPTFEFWLLLHFECAKANLADCAAAESELTRLHGKLGLDPYTKSKYPLNVYLVKESVNRACKYADSVRDHHYETDMMNPRRYWAKDFTLRPGGAGSPDGNPSTDVDQLILQLNLAANPRFRFVHFGNLPDRPFKR